MLSDKTVVSGTVVRATDGPGIGGTLVTVKDDRGLSHQFVVRLGGLERGDAVTITLKKARS